jgi:hypothetical protein
MKYTQWEKFLSSWFRLLLCNYNEDHLTSGDGVLGMKWVLHFSLQLPFETSLTPINMWRVTLQIHAEMRVDLHAPEPLKHGTSDSSSPQYQIVQLLQADGQAWPSQQEHSCNFIVKAALSTQ